MRIPKKTEAAFHRFIYLGFLLFAVIASAVVLVIAANGLGHFCPEVGGCALASEDLGNQVLIVGAAVLVTVFAALGLGFTGSRLFPRRRRLIWTASMVATLWPAVVVLALVLLDAFES